MGHRKHHAPRRGSLAYRPRKRAGTFEARIRSWPTVNDGSQRLLGFPAYKSGMVHVIELDQRERTPNFGKPLYNAATVLVAPPAHVVGLRLYRLRPPGEYVLGEAWTRDLPKEMAKKLRLKAGDHEGALAELKDKLPMATRAVALLASIPREAGLSQKKPFLFEVSVGGNDAKARFEYVAGLLGKAVRVHEVFRAGEYVDVAAVSKGRGFEGPVTRFGVKRKPHKSRKSVRALGTLGPWHPANVMYTVPRAGQTGFHNRIEYNKRILVIGNGSEKPVAPKGGFLHFGVVDGDYVIVRGSVPGSTGRLVKLRTPMRSPSEKIVEPKVLEMVVRG